MVRQKIIFKCLEYAAVAKLANAGVSKASDGNIVQVQVLSAAPKIILCG